MTKIKAVLFTALLALVLAGCGGASGSSKGLTSSDVVDAFKDSRLVVEDKREMTKEGGRND